MGISEILVIAAVFTLVFGARRLPGLGAAIGHSFRSFRKGLRNEKRPVREVHEIESDKSPDED